MYWCVTVYCCWSPHLPDTEYCFCSTAHTLLHRSWISLSRAACWAAAAASLREAAVSAVTADVRAAARVCGVTSDIAGRESGAVSGGWGTPAKAIGKKDGGRRFRVRVGSSGFTGA